MSMLDPNNSLSPLVDPNPGLYSSLTDSQRQSPRQSPRRPDDREAHSSLPNLALIPDTHHDPKSDHQNDSLRWRWALCGVRSVPKFRALLNPSSRRCAPIRSRLVDLNQATSDRGAILPEFYSENCGHGAGPVRQDCDSDASVWDEDVIGIRTSSVTLQYRSSVRIMVKDKEEVRSSSTSTRRVSTSLRDKTSTKVPIVRPAIRLPKDLCEKMPSAPNTPISGRKDQISKLANSPSKKSPKTVASMVRSQVFPRG